MVYGEIVPPYHFLNQETVDREVAFGLILQDKGGNKSNYAESGRITLKKP
jgi:hypothetical protein